MKTYITFKHIRYLLILILLVILIVLLFVGCYTGVPGMSTYSPSPGIKPGETIYYNKSDDGSVQTFFHEGGVTNCVVTESTVTCY